MKHIYTLLFSLTLLLLGQTLFAQQLRLAPLAPSSTQVKRCYTVEVIDAFRRTHPNAETDQQFENWLAQKTIERKSQRVPVVNYTIPVVFHVIHNGEAVGTAPNISAALIRQQILQLNKDYANQSNSPYAVAANTGIQFALAQKDPSNNVMAEPGIDRINRNDLGFTDYTTAGWTSSYVDSDVKPATIWNATRYFNIWLCPDINNGVSQLLGYATFPTASTLTGLSSSESGVTAGVVIASETVGSVFTPSACGSYGLGKTLSHEVGHFFGLRHIWGDANCGTDYCNDTPTHQTDNSGVPTHPKSNSCGTADEMFENYMDYCDDLALNTFTADQVDRMQTVMLNSPRRVTLATSTVGLVAVTGSNRISFINCTGKLAQFETGVNTTYPRYRDLSLPLNVEDKATGAATVTITATGTAISGTQYLLQTPTVTFATGDNFKPVNIRLYDNALVDGDRTIILNYTISGTGVTAGTTSQSLTITLQDDDNIRIGENSINLLEEHFDTPTATTFGLPTGWGLLRTAAYPNPFVGSLNGDAGGTGGVAHISNDQTLRPNTYTKGASGAAVLQTPVIDATSVTALGNLSFKYKTRGRNNADQAFLTYTPSDAPTGPFFYFGTTGGAAGYGPYSSNTTTLAGSPVIAATSNLLNTKFNLAFYWQTGTATTGVNPGFNVDDVILAATPFKVETAVSSSYGYDIASGTGKNNFKSTNNRAIASVSNANALLTNVTANITQAGTGQAALTTQNGNFQRTQKVFQIGPSTANSTATYTVSLYFTSAELAIWGANRLSLKVLKVKDGVSLSSVLNPSNAELVTPTVTEDVAAGYITYTATFTTGFSQFMLVSPSTTIPVNFLSFRAQAATKTILLDWSTAQEINNRGYAIERSLDGNSFAQIGWLNGNGTTSLTSNYQFTDRFVQPNVTYYYRLRQVDVDGRIQYSVIRNARIVGANVVSVSVSPNPAKGYSNLFIAGSISAKANVQIINSLGQVVKTFENVNTANSSYRMNLGNLAKGAYSVKVQLGEGSFTEKLIIE